MLGLYCYDVTESINMLLYGFLLGIFATGVVLTMIKSSRKDQIRFVLGRGEDEY